LGNEIFVVESSYASHAFSPNSRKVASEAGS
jgi:hypothetical protein